MKTPTIIWTRYGWIAKMFGSQHHTGIKHTSYTGRRCEYLAGDLPANYPVPSVFNGRELDELDNLWTTKDWDRTLDYVMMLVKRHDD